MIAILTGRAFFFGEDPGGGKEKKKRDEGGGTMGFGVFFPSSAHGQSKERRGEKKEEKKG